MCYSLVASIVAGCLTYFAVIYCWLRNANYRDRWNSIWIFMIGSMQWYDAYIWYIHGNGEDLNTCSYNNWLVTYLALATIMLEPIANLFGYMYASNKSVGYRTILFYIFCFIIIPCYGRQIFSAWSDPKCGRNDNHCCAKITDGYHVLYAYARDSYGTFKCWRKYYFFGELQEEIPLILRVAFLLGIIYPYRYSNPFGAGIINALIIIISWFLGYYSDAHASVWCWAVSLQSIYLIFFDTYLFPNGYDKKNTQIMYDEINTKQTGEILQNRYHKNKIPSNLDAIVIGSGIGSLSAAALLSKSGYKVLVLGQHCHAFDNDIHYVGAINGVKLFLSFITTNLIEWYSMGDNNDNIYDTIDLDGIDFKKDVIQFRGGKDRLMKELIRKFPKSKENIINYFNFLGRTGWKITYLYLLSKIFPNSFLFSEDGLIYKVFICRLMKYTKMTANEVIDKYIFDSKLKAIIGGGQLINWCLIPSKASIMNYYIDGAYYPKGGSKNIPLSIIPVITKNGGHVLCDAKVKEILINEKTDKAYGVLMDNGGDIIKAPLIISNVGTHTLFCQLLPQKYSETFVKELKYLKENDELEPSYGYMTAFITFNGTSEELDLPDYNIHSFSNLKKYNYDISKIQELFYTNPIKYGDEALICLTFPSAKDPFYDIKFPNKSNALLLSEGKYEWFEKFESNNYGKRAKEYKDFKNSFKDMFMKRLIKYCPNVKDKIIDIEIGTPLSSLHFLNTYKGGSYGVGWNTKRFNHNYTKKYFNANAANIKNLYITGESSLFGGFAGALCSGYVTACKILGWKKIMKIALTTTRVEE
eukprot:242320_1